MPGYAWLDEDVEHSDEDCDRAAAIARRITLMRQEDERRAWARRADAEDGRCWEPDLDECEVCGGTGCLKSGPVGEDGALPPCTNPECQDGLIVTPLREQQKREAAARADRNLEEEILLEKLDRLGARMMRPYEHWNEDEWRVQYMEEGRFG